jgi:zinc protease
MHTLFPAGHPYYGNVMGSHADIESARIADVRDFHQQYYTPNNASIAIAGDFDPKELRAMLTKYFGPIPRGPVPPPVNVTTLPITSQKRVTVTDTVKLPQIRFAWLTPPAYTQGQDDADAAIYALGGGKASRLDEALVYKSQLAQSVTCGNNALKLTGMAQCIVTARPGVKLEDIEAVFWKELQRLQQEGPTADEIASWKASTLTATINGLQRLGGFGGVADTLDEYNQYTGDPGFLPKDVAMVEAVTPARAKAAAVKYFASNATVVVSCVPGDKKLQDVPRSPEDTDANVKLTDPYSAQFETSQEWRKTVPKAGAPPAVHLPVPSTFTLENGLKVYLVEDHALPILSASFVSRAGSETNPQGKGGLATLTAETMGDGTESRDLKKLADDEELVGVRISPGASMDGSSAGMSMLTSNTDHGIELLSDVIEHPAFRQEDVDLRRKQRLTRIAQETDSVQAMAQRVGPKLVFGDSPYGQSISGTRESVEALNRDDLTSFYKSHYGPADSALLLAGDITPAEARRVAEVYFGKWTGTASEAVTLPPAPEMQATHIVIVDKPGAPQTMLMAFGLGLPANSPELPALQVMNYTLGGSFASRINMNLREEHGYTYGASSGYRSYRAGGQFIAGGLVRTDVTAPAARELMKEITQFPSNPPTEAELTASKDALVQSLPGNFETTFSATLAMQSIFLYDRPLDYYAKLPERYRAVTAEDVARVAKEDLHPNALVIVAAGDRAKIEPGLKDAGLGTVEVRDINGDLATK